MGENRGMYYTDNMYSYVLVSKTVLKFSQQTMHFLEMIITDCLNIGVGVYRMWEMRGEP